MTMRCSVTGIDLRASGDGIVDEGEVVSWEYMNPFIERSLSAESRPRSELLLKLLAIAREYKEHTGRILPILGEIGELYAEIEFGIRRHKPGAQGSDGKIGKEFVEVKTITPENRRKKIRVRRAGNFSRLLIVKIDDNFCIDARMVERSQLSKGSGKMASISWSSLPKASGRGKAERGPEG